MPVDYGIPTRTSSSGPNIGALHPEFRLRLRKALTDTRLSGSRVYSGARTIEHQTALYRSYLARNRRHPVVANPNYRNPSTGRYGPLTRYKPLDSTNTVICRI